MSAQLLLWAVQIVSLIAISCDHQNCWSLSGLESKFTSGSHRIFDGNYMLQGCHNDKAYYLASNGYYLYWSAQHTNWHIYTSLYEAGSSAHCQENSLLRCSSNSGWRVVDGDSWVSAPTANNVVCATTHPSYHPTIHPSIYPSNIPSSAPSNIPTTLPTDGPSTVPSTAIPSSNPSAPPSTKSPTVVPTLPPSFRPTEPQLNIAIIPTDSPVNVRLTEQQVLDQTTEFSQTEQEDSMEIMILSDELIGGLSLAFLCVTCFCVIVVWSKWYQKKKSAVVKMVDITHGGVGSRETDGQTQDGDKQTSETTGNTDSELQQQGQTANQLKVQSNEPNMNANVLSALPVQAEVEDSSSSGSDLYDHDTTMQTVGAANQSPGCANNTGICEDCGLDKPGKVYDENGLFYCADCQSYYTPY